MHSGPPGQVVSFTFGEMQMLNGGFKALSGMKPLMRARLSKQEFHMYEEAFATVHNTLRDAAARAVPPPAQKVSKSRKRRERYRRIGVILAAAPLS